MTDHDTPKFMFVQKCDNDMSGKSYVLIFLIDFLIDLKVKKDLKTFI